MNSKVIFFRGSEKLNNISKSENEANKIILVYVYNDNKNNLAFSIS